MITIVFSGFFFGCFYVFICFWVCYCLKVIYFIFEVHLFNIKSNRRLTLRMHVQYIAFVHHGTVRTVTSEKVHNLQQTFMYIIVTTSFSSCTL